MRSKILLGHIHTNLMVQQFDLLEAFEESAGKTASVWVLVSVVCDGVCVSVCASPSCGVDTYIAPCLSALQAKKYWPSSRHIASKQSKSARILCLCDCMCTCSGSWQILTCECR